MKREELLRTKEYWLVNIQNDIFNLIDKYRKKKNINQTQLGRELGVSKGYISQVLNGDFDHKISKLVELSLAFNKAPIISFCDLDEYIKNDAEDKYYELLPLKPVVFVEFEKKSILPLKWIHQEDFVPSENKNQRTRKSMTKDTLMPSLEVSAFLS